MKKLLGAMMLLGAIMDAHAGYVQYDFHTADNSVTGYFVQHTEDGSIANYHIELSPDFSKYDPQQWGFGGSVWEATIRVVGGPTNFQASDAMTKWYAKNLNFNFFASDVADQWRFTLDYTAKSLVYDPSYSYSMSGYVTMSVPTQQMIDTLEADGGYRNGIYHVVPHPVPEPASLALFGMGLFAMFKPSRRK